MDEKDLQEHWDNIALVSKLKKSNKYNYLEMKKYQFNLSNKLTITLI